MISEKARQMAALGKPVIDLGLGEPDFDTPSHIIEAAYAAARRGETRYPTTSGTASLRAAIVEKFNRDNGLRFAPDQVLVANGAKQVIFDALMATVEPGHEVIVCAPYFDSYRHVIKLVGGTVQAVPCRVEEGFLLSPEALEQAITASTRWLILNSPSNPAGAVYSAVQYRALAQVLVRHPQVLVLSDEIYEHILFDGLSFVSFAAACPELAERTLTVNGVSKAYAMTGWRIGYGAGPRDLISAMAVVQSQVSSGACSVAQAAALAALTGPQVCVHQFCSAFEERRNLVVDAVARMPGLFLRAPQGAFYALVDCRELLAGEFTDDASLTAQLLKEAEVAAVPGSVYGAPGFFRISTATDTETLRSAMQRIALFAEVPGRR
jgi:aspartate aminotransferase